LTKPDLYPEKGDGRQPIVYFIRERYANKNSRAGSYFFIARTGRKA
jgi:hypothetical protein